MDRTVKFLLGLIAFSLISLNLQLAGVEVEIVGEAQAQEIVSLDSQDYAMISRGLRSIASAITSKSCD